MKTNRAFKSEQGRADVHKTYEKLLEHWMMPNEKIFINTHYGETFVIVSGEKEAPPLILLHGSAMNSVMWMGDAPTYSRNFRVYAVDLPGEPGKSDERQLAFDSPDFALWLEDVFTALSVNQASFVGISLGAWVAMKFSIQHPEKVKALVLLSPAGVGSQRVSFLITSAMYRLLGEKVRSKLYSKVNGKQTIPEVVLRYQKLIDLHFNYRREILPVFRDDGLRRLTMPTAVFVGAKDTMFHSSQTIRRFEKLAPHAVIHVLEDAGHVLINLSEKINSFLLDNSQQAEIQ